jgi:hypothetical protein
VILELRAIREAPVCFHSVLDTNISLDYSEELFLSSLISCKEVLIVTDLNDVFLLYFNSFLTDLGVYSCRRSGFFFSFYCRYRCTLRST